MHFCAFIIILICSEILLFLCLPTNTAMGCTALRQLPDNTLTVMTIDSQLEQTGLLTVTKTDLLFSSKKTRMQWPIKFVRRYGYDSEVFFIDAGKR